MTVVHTEDCPVRGRSDSHFESELVALTSSLRTFAHFLTRSPAHADDLVQDTFLKALLRKEQYTEGTNLRAWLFTIMKNHWYSYYRRSWRERPIDSEFIERFPDQRDDLAREDAEEFVHELAKLVPFLARLPSGTRDALIGIHYLGFQYEDVSFILNVEVGTIKSRVHRAIERLHALLDTGSTPAANISRWASATEGYSRKHPYYPIAKAYEEIYALVSARHRNAEGEECRTP